MACLPEEDRRAVFGGGFRAPARVTFGPDEIFLSFASGGLLLSIATKVTKSAIQGGRDFDFPSPLKNPYP